jgi:hypothetical protein
MSYGAYADAERLLKDFTLKSAKEMQGANGGMQIRMGGPAVIQQ